MRLDLKTASRRPGFLAAVVLLALAPSAAVAVVPVTGPPLVFTEVAINDGPGDQYNPHVSGDWAVYSSGDVFIRYYNFITGVDAEIPMGPSVRDALPDVSGSRIVFSRTIDGVKTSIMLFDAATAGPAVEIDPAPTSVRLGSAIGGDTVAYIDYGLEGHGELVIHDLATSTSVRLTDDTVYDASPSVSADGNVVVWQHCPTSTSNCDIWQAVKTGSSWIAGAAQDSAYPEANPDTNGRLVAYNSLRNNQSGIFWRPVPNGPETSLELAGRARNPRVEGDFITFESQATSLDAADIFVYDSVNNRLFQITDTPASEGLDDITVLPDGRLRVVWDSDEDGIDSRNIHAVTFELPNVAPTLAYSAEAGYGADGVNPDSGPAATSFIYKVVYADYENAAPQFVDACIDGTCHGMTVDTAASPSLHDGDYRNGEQYVFATALAAGTHSYFFEASDGSDPARLPATGTLSGPSVQGGAAPQINDLIALLRSYHLSRSIAFPLEATLVIARAFASCGDTAHSCIFIDVFIGGVQSLTGHGITAAQANQLVALAIQVKATLGCP